MSLSQFHMDEDDNSSTTSSSSSSSSSSSPSPSSSNQRSSTSNNNTNPVAFLTPPPPSSVGHSGDTPIRMRMAHSPSISRYTSPIPSLSSTPTGGTSANSRTFGLAAAASAAGTNTNGINTNEDMSGTGSWSSRGSQSSTNILSRSYQEMANRPRTDSRNRTPRRNANVVLGTVNRAIIVNEDLNGSGTPGTSPSVSRSNTPGGGSIERETSILRSGNVGNTVVGAVNPGTGGIGLGAGLAVGTVLRSQGTRLSALREYYRENQPTIKSDKQQPGQRKQRRWNNDKFIGIASEISHSNPMRGSQIANLYAQAEMEKGKYTMPNFPRNYRTIFGTLASSTTTGIHQGDLDLEIQDSEAAGAGATKIGHFKLTSEQIAKVRQRFIDGETSDSNEQHNDLSYLTPGAIARRNEREKELYNDGRRMVKENMQLRLLNVVERTCQNSNFTKSVLDAFERLLVKHLPHLEKNDIGAAAPIDDNTRDNDIWDKILVQKPFVSRKLLKSATNNGNDDDEDDNNQPNVMNSNVIIRFLFEENGNKGAFNRLVLHALSQFHGLDAAASTTRSGIRMITITGIMKGSHIRLLDYLDCSVVIGTSNDVEGAETMIGNDNTKTKSDPIPIASMASLQVSS